MTDASVRLIPRPPYSSGMSAPSSPVAVIACTNASGYERVRSSSRQYSSGKPLQNSRTRSRNASYGLLSVTSPPSPQRAHRLPFGQDAPLHLIADDIATILLEAQ